MRTLVSAIAAVLFLPVLSVAAQPPDPLKDARIALRLGTDRVLIIGGEIHNPSNPTGPFDASVDAMPQVNGHALLQPGESIYRASPNYLAHFRIDPPTHWHVGDRWQIYTGAGPAITVIIQEPSFISYCGGLGGYATAVARFETSDAANRVAGLRASEYLAAPAQGLPQVSQRPLMPVEILYENDLTQKIENAMLTRARAAVTHNDWKVNSDNEQARRMDQTFLSGANLRTEMHLSRFTVTGHYPLLFAELIWKHEHGDAVFAANAVLEEGPQISILDFDPRPAAMMRFGEFQGGWKRQEPGVFLNAWAVSNRRFVLRLTTGYEGFEPELMEIVPGKGLVPTKIVFSASC